jgi:hypothetical protein
MKQQENGEIQSQQCVIDLSMPQWKVALGRIAPASCLILVDYAGFLVRNSSSCMGLRSRGSASGIGRL